MAEHVVFLVHGIGGQSFTNLEREPKDEWAKPVVAAFDTVWASLPKLDGLKRTDYVELVPITYDQVFHDYLEQLAKHANGMKEILDASLGESKAKDALEALGDVSAEDAGFFWDSVFDIFLYRFGDGVAKQVHEVIMDQMVKVIRERKSDSDTAISKFSVVSHSLGTAAAHGAIDRLGRALGKETAFALEAGAFHFETCVTLANVSRLLWMGEQEIYDSTTVRPTTAKLGPGYVDTFVNVWHVADPIPRPRRFAPRGWEAKYEEFALDHMHDVNVHGFEHYMKHPRVVLVLLRSLYGDRAADDADVVQVMKKFQRIVAPNAARRQKLEAALATVVGILDAEFASSNATFKPTARSLVRALRPLLRVREELAQAGEDA